MTLFKAIRTFQLRKPWAMEGRAGNQEFLREGTIFEIPDSYQWTQKQVIERELAIVWKHNTERIKSDGKVE
jgi:hypothetical protein